MEISLNKIKNNPEYIGFLLLKEIKKNKKSSIYDLYEVLKKNNLLSSRQLTIGLSFLFALGLIDFKEANICLIE